MKVRFLRFRELSELSRVIAKIDPLIVHLLARRADVVVQVDRVKRAKNQPIRRPDIEEERIREIREYAKQLGTDSRFAASILRKIIAKSCREQERMRRKGPAQPEIVDDELWQKELRQNLLRLTRAVARKYEEYGGIATKAHLAFERRMLDRYLLRGFLFSIPRKPELAVDLGCASGLQTRHLAHYFNRVVGLDISPAMIEEARKRSMTPRTEFLVHDMEQGLPWKDESVSFVLMNMGTASDIVRLPELLREIKRILLPRGAAFLSFYNEDALFYTLGVPYYPGLSAEFNEMRNTLDVRFGKNIYRIFARPYTVSEVRGLLKDAGLQVRKDCVWSHPTLASLIPDIQYEEKGLRRMEEADEMLATRCMGGAYLIVVAEKT